MKTPLLLLLIAAAAPAQSPATLAGDWIVTYKVFDEPDIVRWKIENKNGEFRGDMQGAQFKSKSTGDAFEFTCSYERDKETKSCGTLTGTWHGSEMKGAGTLFDDPVAFTATRDILLPRKPARHEFVPTTFCHHFSGTIPPVLHVNPGDAIHTKSVDAGGTDENGVRKTQGGNPLTGPFFIDGALPGDTLVVHLDRLRLNRASAGVFSDSVSGSALSPYYFRDQKREKDFDSSWKLDRDQGVAMLSKPTGRLKDFQVKLQPMLGCVGVAPSGEQAFRSGNLGRFGGNMDYSQIKEDVTLYLPVFQTGALLFVGDGHALQGDGELTGNALETSMDIEFTVDLVRGKSLGQPRFEDDEFVMVSGVAGSLNEALQSATTGLSRWLGDEYKLTTGEIAMVLATTMRYDIAEVVDPQVHIVAKISKRALAQIHQP